MAATGMKNRSFCLLSWTGQGHGIKLIREWRTMPRSIAIPRSTSVGCGDRVVFWGAFLVRISWGSPGKVGTSPVRAWVLEG
jgi:hypothetical protein